MNKNCARAFGFLSRVGCVIGLAWVGCSSIAVAGTFENYPVKDKCKQVTAKPIIYDESYVGDVYRQPYFYIGGGIGAYHLQSPSVGVGNVQNGSAPIASPGNKVAPIYALNFGYAFYNPRSSMFGALNDINFKISYLQNDSKVERDGINRSARGELWKIDGSGTITVNPAYLDAYALRAKHQLLDTGLYYRSVPSVSYLSKVSFHPRFGLVATYLRDEYHYVVRYDRGFQNFSNDDESYKADTYYYGIGGGEKVVVHLARQFLLFGDAEVQLLHATSSLHSTQQTDTVSPNPVISVNSSYNKAVTYRAIAAVGTTFFCAPRINSISFSLKGGIDRFGYSPKVVTPSRDNSGGKIHLVGVSQNNWFANLDMIVPLG